MAVAQRKAWPLLFLVVVLWGCNWPVMKVGLDFIPPLHFAAARMCLGAVTLGIVAAAVGSFRLPTRADMPLVLGVGLLQMAGFLALVNTALQYVPAGRSAILAYTTSLWVLPMAALFLRERLAPLKALGMLLGMTGVAVLFNPLGFDWSDPQVLLGNGLLLCAAFLWAALIVLVRGYHGDSSPLTLGFWQFTLATAVLLPLALLLEDSADIVPGTTLAVILFYNGPAATAFCFWGMITVTQSLPAITTSLATLAVPVVGSIAAAVSLGEPITATNGLGLGCIVAGLALVSVADWYRRPAAVSR
ncbi:integral membrane protein [Salinisphaera sp. PC39]|uniref:DMT family transporter n=1 Tax=Salinisphaera sp. PC39 TaxID=1304156 RepID=UPI00333FAB5C